MAIALLLSACANSVPSEPRTVDVSLYSGMANPRVEIPGDLYAEALECVRGSDDVDRPAPVDNALPPTPSFLLEDGDALYYVARGQVTRTDHAGSTTFVGGCGEYFSDFREVAGQQLTTDQLAMLDAPR